MLIFLSFCEIKVLTTDLITNMSELTKIVKLSVITDFYLNL